jgi:hypothetical protein
MRFVTLYVRSVYRTGSLKSEARKLTEYNSDSVGVKEIRQSNDYNNDT